MRYSKGLYPGFSLIELLVVMAIMLSTIALVGPFSFEYIERSKAQDERIMLQNWIAKVSNEAFLTESKRAFFLRGKAIYQCDANCEVGTDIPQVPVKIFEFVFFPEQILLINESGFLKPDCISYYYRDVEYSLALFERCEGASNGVE